MIEILYLTSYHKIQRVQPLLLKTARHIPEATVAGSNIRRLGEQQSGVVNPQESSV